jgi:putative SOS response-associated peptidase YedK
MSEALVTAFAADSNGQQAYQPDLQYGGQTKMCGRFPLTASPDEPTAFFGLATVPPLEPRYNIAPAQEDFAVRADQTGYRQGALLKWGLIPSWTNDPGIGGPPRRRTAVT